MSIGNVSPSSSSNPVINSDGVVIATPINPDSTSTAQGSSSNQIGTNFNDSLLNYLSTVTSANLQSAKQFVATFLQESTQYFGLRQAQAVSASEIQAQITAIQGYENQVASINTQITTAVTTFNAAATAFNNEADNVSNDFNEASNAVAAFNSADVTDPSQETGYDEALEAGVANYNNDVSGFNAALTTYLAAQTAYNNTINSINTQITGLNTQFAKINADLPLLTPGPLSPVDPLEAPISQVTLALPNGEQGNYLPGQFFYGSSFYGETPPLPAPDAPFGVQGVTFTPPTIDPTIIDTEFVAPLMLLLNTIVIANKAATSQANFKEVSSTSYGQPNAVAGPAKPTAQPNVGSGGTAGSTFSSISTNSKGNPNVSSQQAGANLAANQNVYGIPAGSPNIAVFEGFAQNAFSAGVLGAVPAASVLAGTALVGPSPSQSPAITASVALSTLNNIQNFVSSNETYDFVLQQLEADPANSGVSQTDLDAQATQIAAAINSQVLGEALNQLANTIGASGLLPQLLSVGGANSSDVAQLELGQVNFNQTQEGSLQQEQILNETATTLQSNTDLSYSQAYTLAQNALQTAQLNSLNQTNQQTETAFLANLQQQLQTAGVSQADASQASNQVASNLNNNSQLTTDTTNYLQKNALINQVENQINQSNLDAEDKQNLIAEINTQTENALTANAAAQIAQTILSNQNVQNGSEIVANALSYANNPLIIPGSGQPLTSEQLYSSLNQLIQTSLNQPGANQETVENEAATYTNSILNGPNSVPGIIQHESASYAKAANISQSNAVVELYNSSLSTNWNASQLANDKYNTANYLVYADKPAYAGTHSKVMGPGSPAGFGYINNDSSPV